MLLQCGNGMKDMLAKLRQVGNSLGLTIPANELRAINAKLGDEVEIEIKQVVHHVRASWENPDLWPNADNDAPLLKDTSVNNFDNEEWEW